MATSLKTQDIIGLFKALKDDILTKVLNPRGMSIKSSGTKNIMLGEPLSTETGFWQNPQAVSSKPPRWIPQVEVTAVGVEAKFARDAEGQILGMAKSIGYINNRDGSCSVCAFRILPAIKPLDPDSEWEFPDGWEYLFILGFANPLPAGTSGDSLGNFDPTAGTIDFGGGVSKRTFPIGFRALVKAPVAVDIAAGTTYADVGNAIAQLAGATLYDGTQVSDRDNLVSDLSAIFSPTPVEGVFSLDENTSLVGIEPSVYQQIEAAINSGKRHIIFYGPPGTGKTTLAEYLAAEVSERDDGDGSYLMLTASSAWSSQDLVGGYQPLGNGAIGFVPGALLRNFDKPIIIDELNRCPIDKVLGPLFSILSGQSSALPCRVDVADPASPFHVIYPKPHPGMEPHEHAPEPAWRMICTLNTYDKTQLGQISYALSRRFAWIKIGAPADPDGFVREMAMQLGATVIEPVASNPIGALWKAVNSLREIGGAPIVDFIKTMIAFKSDVNLFEQPEGNVAGLFLSAFRMCVLPLMDGLSPREARDLAESISVAWGLDAAKAASLTRDCVEFSA
ncbi:AAA family ATPase [Enterobacter ludwigii]|uniref:AAA family ATPase n=1 Tax=Enterobacter ludwigii TaxID=299767 RepID=UPI0005CF976D|nr:AAA family ATPase [Enterobacter ludwigii]